MRLKLGADGSVFEFDVDLEGQCDIPYFSELKKILDAVKIDNIFICGKSQYIKTF